MEKRVIFKNKILPYFLVAPQIIITLVFFIWPAFMALYQSVQEQDPFGLSTVFVGLENFRYIFSDPIYLNSIKVTIIFSLSVAISAMSLSLLLAVMADRAIRGATAYKTFIIWPYAVAPVAAAVQGAAIAAGCRATAWRGVRHRSTVCRCARAGRLHP